MKASAVAPSNLAFIKYWGLALGVDPALRIPANDSISVCLDGLTTTTTVETIDEQHDVVVIDGREVQDKKVQGHLDRLRAVVQSDLHVRVESENSFPSGTGLSSSASGLAVLTVAASHVLGIDADERQLTMLARQGSGSAARSIPDGFVRWYVGEQGSSSYAESIAPAKHWELDIVVAVTSHEKKYVPTSDGHTLAGTSPLFAARQAALPERIDKLLVALDRYDFTSFGSITEAVALELHAIMLTSTPALIYWTEGTLRLMKAAQRWRADGLEAYFSLNTGQNLYFVCEPEHTVELLGALKDEGVTEILLSHPGGGTRLVDEHLF